MTHPILYRSLLYVPATRPERIDKAHASGADAVIIDWEDAVSASHKTIARDNTIAHDKTAQHAYWLRINATDTTEHNPDLNIARTLNHLEGVFLPKVECAAQIEQVALHLNRPVIAIIETARGQLNLADIASAKGLHSLSFGLLDLANDLNITLDSPAAHLVLNRLRNDLLLHSSANQLAPPIDTIYPSFNDHEGLRNTVIFWRDLGFAGMMCIHPKQIATIHDTLRPSQEALALARRIAEEAQKSDLAAFQIEGKMIDTPLIRRARALIAQYGE